MERAHRIDLIIALTVGVASVVELLLLDVPYQPVAVPLALVGGGALAFRRRLPLLVGAICVGALAVDQLVGVPTDGPTLPIVWIFLSMYGVGAYLGLRRSLVGLAVALVLFSFTLFRTTSDLVFGLAVLCTPWLAGRALRSRTRENAELVDRTVELQREQQEAVVAAAAAERRRIARDLHDVIAHSVSVMVVQAAGAQEMLHQHPERTADALGSIQETGRQALTEMSTLLGILREDGEEIGLAPSPGLNDLERLLEQTRTGGLPVELRVTGPVRPVPAGIGLSVYRVVQEALTNTRKHARGARAVVCVTYSPDAIAVEVVDDGLPSGNGYGGAQGLVGMRERVAVYGGSLSAGPRADGGYAVRALIPLQSGA